MSDIADKCADVLAGTVETIGRLREALAALEKLAAQASDFTAIDAAEVHARALDAMRQCELREEEHARYRENHAARIARDAEYAAYLAAHLAVGREQTEALRAILAEVTRSR